ncbi:MAG: glucose-methanol-choline oxidoreductase [Subtercola sp.]|nr:glucose-methanol-choline oxidoreductase [Subtercola sp.]
MNEALQTHFAVIVVGAGASGAPLAARLSEDPARSVLLLEAGPVPASRAEFPAELISAGTVEGARPGHPDNWSFDAWLTPDRPYSIARGRIAGGSTTVNGSYFVRARRGDFEAWEAGEGSRQHADVWSFDAVLPFYRALESDADFGDSPVHGSSGPMPVQRPARDSPLTRAFVAAAHDLGYPDEPDKNDQGVAGVGPLPMNIAGGVRFNTAFAYLEPAAGRPNLVVRGDSVVRRVLFDRVGPAAVASDGLPRAVGVEVEHDGQLSVVTADEIVLSAGSIKTPHLLLLSGIGPRAELEAAGVTVVREAAGVGAAFSDHPQLAVDWWPKPGLVDYGTPQSFAVSLNFASPNSRASSAAGGSVSADARADLEILPFLKPNHYLLTGEPLDEPLTMLVSLMAETSRGTIRLVSADPAVPPRIDYNYLQTDCDRARLRDGVRAAVALLRSKAYRGVFDRLSVLDDEVLGSNERLDEWMRANVGTAIHLCASAPFGEPGDPNAVVDRHGLVFGVTGLRIADTSILPTAPTRGPAATAVMIGERMAALMQGEAGLGTQR